MIKIEKSYISEKTGGVVMIISNSNEAYPNFETSFTTIAISGAATYVTISDYTSFLIAPGLAAVLIDISSIEYSEGQTPIDFNALFLVSADCPSGYDTSTIYNEESLYSYKANLLSLVDDSESAASVAKKMSTISYLEQMLKFSADNGFSGNANLYYAKILDILKRSGVYESTSLNQSNYTV